MTNKQIFGVIGIFILLMIVVSVMRSDDTTEANITELSVDIGKTFCNATTNECKGEIINVKPCNVAPELDCYVVDYGPNYSRPAERPISNSYVQ